jgi:hypothetical protein
MRSFVVVTLIGRMDGSVGIVANYDLDKIKFEIKLVPLCREFVLLHSILSISGTNMFNENRELLSRGERG